MLLKDIGQLKFSKQQAIIINVGTKSVTTLALLSALRFAEMPVLVVDCESNDGSFEHFTALMKDYDFDLLAAPLKKHGDTLDWLFKNIPAENVLLVDSDVEILSADIIGMMETFIGEANVFGCGFTHGPCWLPDHAGIGFYHERMWIPLTLLKVRYVREALAAGHSFMDKTIPNDFAASRFISKLLALRFRHSSAKNWKLAGLNWFKKSFYGLKPSYVFCDTGAIIHQFLKYERGLHFAGFPAEFHERYVTHFHGVTRSSLDPADTNSTTLEDISGQVTKRLREVYGITE